MSNLMKYGLMLGGGKPIELEMTREEANEFLRNIVAAQRESDERIAKERQDHLARREKVRAEVLPKLREMFPREQPRT
jgi:hypothetical protein